MAEVAPEGYKTCYLCSQTKPLESFEKDSRRPGGRGQRCKVCKNAKYAGTQKEVISEAPSASPSSNIIKVKPKVIEEIPASKFKKQTNDLFDEAGRIARQALAPGAIPVCKECSREMVPEEWVLRKGQCVSCKLKHELEESRKKPQSLTGDDRTPSNRCKCGALLGDHDGSDLSYKPTKCRGYHH